MTNDVIRKRSGQKNLTDMIKKRRLTWLEHLHRREEDYIPKQTIDENPGGRKKRLRRPTQTWHPWCQKWF